MSERSPGKQWLRCLECGFEWHSPREIKGATFVACNVFCDLLTQRPDGGFSAEYTGKPYKVSAKSVDDCLGKNMFLRWGDLGVKEYL